MIDIEVETHADGVGRDQKIHISILVEIDLGVACPWRECPKDDGSAAALSADQFGNRVDVIGGEGDDGCPAGLTRDFF